MTPGLLQYEGGAYPSLALKAWNSRLMVVFFEVVLRTVYINMDTDDQEAIREVEVASAATTGTVAFLDQSERAGRFLQQSEADAMADSCRTYLQLLQVLTLMSLRRSIPRWKCVPKLHSWLHICEDQCASLVNARSYHSYVDEDFIGYWKTLVVQVPKELLELRCLTRYLLRLKVDS